MDEKKKIEWRSFPLKESPLMAVVVVGICALFLFLVYECWTEQSETSEKSRGHPASENNTEKRGIAEENNPVGKGVFFVLIFFGLVLFLSLRRFFLPTLYHLDDEGVSVVTAGWVKRRKWSEFRNAYFHKVGVHLSPFEKPHFLDSFRGLFLRYNRGEEIVSKEVERFVEERIRRDSGRG